MFYCARGFLVRNLPEEICGRQVSRFVVFTFQFSSYYRGMNETLAGTSLTPLQSLQISNVFARAEIPTIPSRQKTPPPDIPSERDEVPSEAADGGSAHNPWVVDDNDRAQAGCSVVKSCRSNFHSIGQGFMRGISSIRISATP